MLTEWKKRLAKGCIAQRYVIAIMGFLAVANAYTMRICLSTAITEMVVHHNRNESETDPDACPSNSVSNNKTAQHGTFDWDEETQGLILSSFFWGYVITHLPGGMLAEKFGGKYALGLGILCTAILSILTPLAATQGGAGWLIAVRFLEGLGEGTTFPALNSILARWVPPQQRGILGSFVFSGSQIGTVVGTALSGVLIEYSSIGWPSVFYLFGSLGVLWFFAWIALCYNDPQSHPFISDEEKAFLEQSIGGLDNKKDIPPVPWREMAKSVPLWGLIFAQIGHDWGFFTLVTDLPKYFKDVMRFNIFENGFLTALPYLTMWIFSMASGWLCDHLITWGCLSTTNARKIFTTIASVGPGVGIIAASYAGCDRTAVVSLITLGTMLMGSFYPGMKVNALDLSPNYAGTLMAIVNGIGAFTGIITPYLVGVLTPDSTILQWREIFWIVFGVFLATNVLFIFMGSGEIQPWNNPLTMEQGVDKANASETNPSSDAEKIPPIKI
ncbi:putative inorganic phosphate cotransporter isoform X2 [Zootermopsis nevadensis]|uniref:putative inorganic phosphate cotransporter isoform X2 n=1 Tax=Zootermopsis nevadensis TaxID=136037 RepID=UPI000B8EBBA9|nr:putative inorganic phosphate cotransporter isoform X2 [Zootermopsis nevadensis]XP_021935627.1 putative inorganic phosphate cotransporter isoform X2 [Zootermopsis nevadensis]XP_021935628.1 putative inorganic phosphate cotransporter isoform X2 [Zootermopsis nevadensis]XP_021935629.1 putative inorganic phosphate cotransporter isoform X2 [Zootermopsis nevadensis]